MDAWGLIGAALLLGLTGGVHCLAMCTGLQQTALRTRPRRVIRLVPMSDATADPSVSAMRCTSAGQSPPGTTLWSLLGFHAARVSAYALMGALVAAASETLRWSAQWAAPLRTAWILLNAAVFSLGLMLMLRGAMPVWIDGQAHRLWRRIQAWGPVAGLPPAGLWGLLWVFLPCGLLASALALALLASDAALGAAVMASFGLGTAVDLMLVQGLWLTAGQRLARAHPAWQRAGVRLSGLLLAAFAAWALWTLAKGQAHPFCIR
jgi:sulfite exporter TauE/SafE